MSRTMPMQVLEAARAAVEHIPGLRIESARWYRMLKVTGERTDECGITLDAWGWGPTLHARHRRWNIVHPVPEGQTEQDGPISDGDAVVLARRTAAWALSQETMACWAEREGIEFPLGQPDAATFDDLRHLSIDRRLLDAMIANRGVQGVAARLMDMLPRIVKSGEGGEETIEADELDSERQGSASIVGGRGVLWFDEPVGARGQYDGTALEIDAELPETALAAAVGRRLGDLIATGIPSLDASIVEVATVGSYADLRLEFAPDLVRTEDVPALRVHLPGGAA